MGGGVEVVEVIEEGAIGLEADHPTWRGSYFVVEK